ncbi:hypothetical protein [Bradyrhizobium genosp. P]|uniref:hypothetical protein n=1 Tax=Bradyrhizobium genosp. P TaxID=83641 RepID=UPI003CF6F0E1
MSKQGDLYLRSLFTAGALAVIRYAKIHGTDHRPWLTRLLARRPTKVAAIALANKLACSGCFRLERLPGGTCTHWKAPPFHGAHPKRTLAAHKWHLAGVCIRAIIGPMSPFRSWRSHAAGLGRRDQQILRRLQSHVR